MFFGIRVVLKPKIVNNIFRGISIKLTKIELLLAKEKISLPPKGVLAPGSAHARPSAQPPIDPSGNFSPQVSVE